MSGTLEARRVVVGLGSNVGSRRAFLRAALVGLSRLDGVQVRSASPVYLTAALGPAQPDYLNAAALVVTERTLPELLDGVRAVERLLGRVRKERWGPRTIDLDVLWAEGPPHRDPTLQVPHPELLARTFALGPLLDLVGDAEPALARALEGLGGRPTSLGPLREVEPRGPGPGAGRLDAAGLDAEDALAALLEAYARLAPPALGPLQARTLALPSRAPIAAAEQVRALLLEGLRPAALALCARADGGRNLHVFGRGGPGHALPRASSVWVRSTGAGARACLRADAERLCAPK